MSANNAKSVSKKEKREGKTEPDKEKFDQRDW